MKTNNRHPLVVQASLKITSYAQKIEKLFEPGAKITIMIRREDDNESDMVVSSDDLDEVMKMVQRAKDRE